MCEKYINKIFSLFKVTGMHFIFICVLLKNKNVESCTEQRFSGDGALREVFFAFLDI